MTKKEDVLENQQLGEHILGLSPQNTILMFAKIQQGSSLYQVYIQLIQLMNAQG